jgi:hypothetical protein
MFAKSRTAGNFSDVAAVMRRFATIVEDTDCELLLDEKVSCIF